MQAANVMTGLAVADQFGIVGRPDANSGILEVTSETLGYKVRLETHVVSVPVSQDLHSIFMVTLIRANLSVIKGGWMAGVTRGAGDRIETLRSF